MNITIIGVGNMGSAIARGLVKSGAIKASQLTCTDLDTKLLNRIQQFNQEINISQNNTEAISNADVVILAVKPWKVESTLSALKYKLNFNKQVLVSIAAGVTFNELSKYVSKEHIDEEENSPVLFRVIPNTAIEVMQSMTFIASHNADKEQEDLIVGLFDKLGNAMLIEEDQMTAGTALASCGIAYALRYIRAAMEGGIELGFYPDQSKEIVVETIQGALDLLRENKSNPETEIDKVTTPGGITIRGLNEMEMNGFTAAVIKGLRESK